MFNRKLKMENTRLKYRIADLEERICPNAQHSFVKIKDQSFTNDGIVWQDVDVYRCVRCGKEIVR